MPESLQLCKSGLDFGSTEDRKVVKWQVFPVGPLGGEKLRCYKQCLPWKRRLVEGGLVLMFMSFIDHVTIYQKTAL